MSLFFAGVLASTAVDQLIRGLVWSALVSAMLCAFNLWLANQYSTHREK